MNNKFNDLLNETVTIKGIKYTITHQLTHDPDTQTLSGIAIREDGKEVVLTYRPLDNDDLESYDIENPIEIADADTGEYL